MACAIINLSLGNNSTAASICSIVDIPVDIITGKPESATFLSNSLSVIEAEAIFITGCFIFARKSTLTTSQGEANNCTLNPAAKSANSLYSFSSNSTL